MPAAIAGLKYAGASYGDSSYEPFNQGKPGPGHGCPHPFRGRTGGNAGTVAARADDVVQLPVRHLEELLGRLIAITFQPRVAKNGVLESDRDGRARATHCTKYGGGSVFGLVKCGEAQIGL